MIEPPEEPFEPQTPQIHNPHMNTEEGLHVNTKRFGFDNTVMPDGYAALEQVIGQGKDYSGHYECENAHINLDDCLHRGNEISHWLTERIINPDSFCD